MRYDARHQRLRASYDALLQAGAAVACARCGLQILPGQSWDLGHLDGSRRDEYSGPEHARCNRRTNTHRASRRTREPEPHPGLRSTP